MLALVYAPTGPVADPSILFEAVVLEHGDLDHRIVVDKVVRALKLADLLQYLIQPRGRRLPVDAADDCILAENGVTRSPSSAYCAA